MEASGIITQIAGLPLSGCTVRAYDKGIRGSNDTLLGEAQTNRQGRYQIAYGADKLSPPGRQSADLVVRVFEGTAQVAESALIPGADSSATVDLKVSAGPCELERLLARVTPSVKDSELDDIKEDELPLLAGRLGLDSGWLRSLRLAAVLRVQSASPQDPNGVSLALLYGILRGGLRADSLLELLAEGRDDWQAALDAALRQNIVTSAAAADLDRLAKLAMERLHGEQLGPVLSSLLHNADTEKKVLNHLLQAKSRDVISSTKLWDSIGADTNLQSIATNLRSGLLRAQSLRAVVGDNSELTGKLLSHPQVKQPRDLALLSDQTWSQIVNDLKSVPVGQREQLKQRVRAQADKAFPTAVFGRDFKPIPGISTTQAQDVRTFIVNNASFDLRHSLVEDVVKQNPDALKGMTGTTAEVINGVKLVQRVYRLADGDTSAYEALARQQIHSAAAVLRLGVHRLSQVTGLYESTATQVHANAKKISTRALALFTRYYQDSQTPAWHVLGSQLDAVRAGGADAGIANWATLFGPLLTECDCSHCASMFGPAAYFADLLQYVVRMGEPIRKTLLTRRPDLWGLELSCKNSDTPLPYIDLVNELLELKVTGKKQTVNATVNEVYQTTRSAEELRLFPEHSDNDAGKKLREAMFPWMLPFTPELNELRLSLEQLGTSRCELLSLVGRGDSDEALRERVQMPQSEWDLLAGKSTPPEYQQWGFDQEVYAGSSYVSDPEQPGAKLQGRWIQILQHVPVLLQRSGLSSSEFFELSSSRFLGLSVLPQSACALGKLTVDASGDWPLRLLRFVRLWRRLKWASADLDAALLAFRLDIVQSELSLRRLLQIEQIHQEFGIPVAQLLPLIQPNLRLNTDTQRFSTCLGIPVDRLKAIAHICGHEALMSGAPELLLHFLRDAQRLAEIPLSIDELSFLWMGEKRPGARLPVADETAGALLRALWQELRARKVETSCERKTRPSGELKWLSPNAASTLKSIRCLSGGPLGTAAFLVEGLVKTVMISSPTWAQQVALGSGDSFRFEANKTYYQGDTWLVRPQLPSGPGLEYLPYKYSGSLAALGDRKEKVTVACVASGPLGQAHFTFSSQSVASGQPRTEYPSDASWRSCGFVVPGTHTQLLFDEADGYGEGDTFTVVVLEEPEFLFRRLGAALQVEPAFVEQLVTAQLATLCAPLLLLAGLDRDDRLLPFAASEAPRAWDALQTISLAANRLPFPQPELSQLFRSASTGALNRSLSELFTLLPPSGKDAEVGKRLDTLRWLGELGRIRSAQTDPALPISCFLPGAADSADYHKRWSEKLGWNLDALSTLGCKAGTSTSPLGLQFPADYASGAALARIDRCLGLLKRLGIDAQRLVTWLADEASLQAGTPNGTVGTELVSAMRALLLTRFGNDASRSRIVAVADTLRERRRQALLAYLMTHQPAGSLWRSVSDLYAELLIDVEMTPAVVSSRLKQAISSVQLFIQRHLLGLESNRIDEKLAKEWEWRKNYRVWEANRKIFLYPENWLEPELRDDMTDFFRDFRNELSQKDITSETAEAALRGYVEKLLTVSQLDICGLCHETDAATGRDVIHIIGRTATTPHVHYYRRYEQQRVFTPWEKIDVDIDSDQLAPVVWNGRLYLFFTKFTETMGKLDFKNFKDENADRNPDNNRQYEVQLNYTEYQQGKWTAKRLSPKFQTQYARYAFLRVDLPAEAGDASPLLLRLRRPWLGLWLGLGELDGLGLGLGGLDLMGNIAPDYWDEGELKLNSSDFSWDVNAAALRHEVLKTGMETTGGTAERQLFSTWNSPPYLNVNSIIKHDSIVTIAQGAKDGFLLNPWFLGLSRQPDTFLWKDAKRSFLITAVNFPGTGSDGSADEPRYLFHPQYHPFHGSIRKCVEQLGIGALFEFQLKAQDNGLDGNYRPAANVGLPPDLRAPKKGGSSNKEDAIVERLDFSSGGSYSVYNWELFFHAPLLIATQLSKNQRFAEAQQWFHRIFDPTGAAGGRVPQCFWRTRPFFDQADPDQEKQTVLQLRYGWIGNDFENAVQQWEVDPFNPHLIARLRLGAYQRSVVMKYIDNLLAWGDQLFRQDTLESINEATQLYILAGDILGQRPARIPPRGGPKTMTFAALENDAGLDPLSNALVEWESHAGGVSQMGAASSSEQLVPLFGLPANDKVLRYWDVVGDRLFKIRNSLNIEGVFRTLSLFDEPLDPGLLMRARAAGIDLKSAIQDANPLRLPYRFSVVIQKALEMCNEARSLGAAMLAAIEKKDAEQLALLRADHEVRLLTSMRRVKEYQRDEAAANLAALEATREVTANRQAYYSTRQFINSAEGAHLELVYLGGGLQAMVEASGVLAAGVEQIPLMITGGAGWAASPLFVTAPIDGTKLANSARHSAEALKAVISAMNTAASMSATIGGYQRRAEDWQFQAQQAETELKQIDKQILSSQIRLNLAEHELRLHDQQQEDAAEIAETLRSKFSNRELYQWMEGQLSTLYFQAYELAYDLAKRAQAGARFELGNKNLKYIEFGYWDSLRKGLLAADQLHYSLKQMELAYLQQNDRDYEITKHISLRKLDPSALMQLRELSSNGTCTVELPEWLFDLDYPGHYMRRIKSVGVSLPCVTGPYTTVNCTLTLTGSRIRHSTSVSSGYAKKSGEDARFIENWTEQESIVTSSAQNDSGLFSADLRDERYLPFEGAGAVSTWELSLPKETNAFDRRTLSDVIIHLRYTARGADSAEFRTAALTSAQKGTTGIGLILSAAHDFGAAWQKFQNTPTGSAAKLSLELLREHFPYALQAGSGISLRDGWLVFSGKSDSLPAATVKFTAGGATGSRSIGPAIQFYKDQPSAPPPSATGTYEVILEPSTAAAALDDIWLVLLATKQRS